MSSQLGGLVGGSLGPTFDELSARRISSSNQSQTNPETVPIFSSPPRRRRKRAKQRKRNRGEPREGSGNAAEVKQERRGEGECGRRSGGLNEKIRAIDFPQSAPQTTTAQHVMSTMDVLLTPFRLWSKHSPRVFEDEEPVHLPFPQDLDLPAAPVLLSELPPLLIFCVCPEMKSTVEDEPASFWRENSKTTRWAEPCYVTICQTVRFTSGRTPECRNNSLNSSKSAESRLLAGHQFVQQRVITPVIRVRGDLRELRPLVLLDAWEEGTNRK